jgi:TonB family protein
MIAGTLFASMSAAEWIVNLAFHSLLVLSMGWFFVKLLKRKPAPLRSKVIFVTMLALLLLPLFSVTYLSFNITFFKTSLPFTGDSRLSNPEFSDAEIPAVVVEHNTPASLSVESAASPRKPSKPRVFLQSILSRITTANVINVAGIIWLVGFLLLLGRLLYGATSLNGFRRELTKIGDVRLDNILRQAQRTFHFKSLPEVYASWSAKSPVVLGIARPLIVIPQRVYSKLSNKEIRSILFHELSHIYHKDQVTGVLQRIVKALYWWNPFVHTLSTDFSKAREEISDNHAIMGNTSREYAECLVNLAEKTALVNRLPFLQGLAIPHIPLKDRIAQILSKERIMATETKKSTTFIILLGFIVSLGLLTGHKWTFASGETEMKAEIAQETVFATQEKQDQKKKKEKEQEQAKEREEQEKEGEQAVEERLTEEVEEAEREELTMEEALVMEEELAKEEQDLEETLVLATEIEQEKEEELEKNIEEMLRELSLKLCEVRVNVEPIHVQKMTLSEEQKEKIRKMLKEVMSNINEVKAKALPAVKFRAETLTDQEKEELRKKIKELSVKIKEMNMDLARKVRVDLERSFEVDTEGKVVVKVKPVLVVKVTPKFPEGAKEKGIYGEVVVEGTTDKKGEVVKVKVLKGAHELLNEAVVAAVKQWKYELPEYKGKSYAITFTVTVRFNPADKDKDKGDTSWTVEIDK